MSKSILRKFLAACLVVTAICATSPAETIFFDDFSDGSVTNDAPLDRDGNPVRWFPSAGNAQLSVEAGDLVVKTSSGVVPLATVSGLNVADTSLRTQFRLRQGGSAGAVLRHTPNASIRGGVFALLSADGTTQVGFSGTAEIIAEAATGLNPLQEDIVMQLDAIGNDVNVWFWRSNESMPASPLISFTNESVSSGSVSVGAISDAYPSSGVADAVFRYVHVADMSIPEASTVLYAALGMAGLLMPARSTRTMNATGSPLSRRRRFMRQRESTYAAFSLG